MVHVEINDLYKKEYTFLWSALSFKAGLLNAAGFLIVGSYVSHVTGFGTQIGLAFGHQNLTLALELLLIPLAFIGGGFVTSLILDSAYSKDQIPNYPLVQFLITLLIGIISISFSFGIFKSQMPVGSSDKSILLVGLLCFVSGLKNGLTTWATHGKIRTTHLTGLSTDIGLHLRKLFHPEGVTSRYPESKKVNCVRLATLISFSVGSCISAILIQYITYRIFYIAFVISLALAVISVLHRKSFYKNNSQKFGGIYANVN
jgi:uncharacterized membrane protein YoaK (UPF0700 family)